MSFPVEDVHQIESTDIPADDRSKSLQALAATCLEAIGAGSSLKDQLWGFNVY
ncbi:hypothetical protein [Rhodococcus koreensis]